MSTPDTFVYLQDRSHTTLISSMLSLLRTKEFHHIFSTTLLTLHHEDIHHPRPAYKTDLSLPNPPSCTSTTFQPYSPIHSTLCRLIDSQATTTPKSTKTHYSSPEDQTMSSPTTDSIVSTYPYTLK